MKIPFFDLYIVKGKFLRDRNEFVRQLNYTCELRKRIIKKLLGKSVKDSQG